MSGMTPKRPKGVPPAEADDYLDSVEVFDVSWELRSNPDGRNTPPVAAWQNMRPLNGRRSAACAVAHGGFIWLMGGFDGTGCTNMVHAYSPQANKWETRKPMLHKRSGASACVGQRHIYVCGGWDGNEALRSVERYNTTLDKWEDINDMHHERSRGLGCAHFGGYVWAMGGMDGNGRALNTVERYDPRSKELGQWEVKMQMCERRCSCAATVQPHCQIKHEQLSLPLLLVSCFALEFALEGSEGQSVRDGGVRWKGCPLQCGALRLDE